MRFPVFLPAASIGIIGGADGPTAIFVTGNWWTLPLGLAVIAAAVVLVVVLLKKRRK